LSVSYGLLLIRIVFGLTLAIVAAAIAIAATGPGRLSLDSAFGWTGGLSGVWWGVGVAAAAAVASLLSLTFGRTHTLQAGPATSSR
jgi:hypothetical protein